MMGPYNRPCVCDGDKIMLLGMLELSNSFQLVMKISGTIRYKQCRNTNSLIKKRYVVTFLITEL